MSMLKKLVLLTQYHLICLTAKELTIPRKNCSVSDVVLECFTSLINIDGEFITTKNITLTHKRHYKSRYFLLEFITFNEFEKLLPNKETMNTIRLFVSQL